MKQGNEDNDRFSRKISVNCKHTSFTLPCICSRQPIQWMIIVWGFPSISNSSHYPAVYHIISAELFVNVEVWSTNTIQLEALTSFLSNLAQTKLNYCIASKPQITNTFKRTENQNRNPTLTDDSRHRQREKGKEIVMLWSSGRAGTWNMIQILASEWNHFTKLEFLGSLWIPFCLSFLQCLLLDVFFFFCLHELACRFHENLMEWIHYLPRFSFMRMNFELVDKVCLFGLKLNASCESQIMINVSNVCVDDGFPYIYCLSLFWSLKCFNFKYRVGVSSPACSSNFIWFSLVRRKYRKHVIIILGRNSELYALTHQQKLYQNKGGWRWNKISIKTWFHRSNYILTGCTTHKQSICGEFIKF